MSDSKPVVRFHEYEMEEKKQPGNSLDDVAPVEVGSLPAPRKRLVRRPMFPARYRCGLQIGRGGIGSVWRVYDRQMDRSLAAKVLLPKYRTNRSANERLIREAKLAGSIQHPGIPPVYEKGELLSGSSFFTMKLVEGKTLDELLSEREHPSENRQYFLNVFRQIAEAVGFAHSKNVIHRDLKPQNVMVGEFGEVQIMDWGMAKSLDEASESGVSATTAIFDETPKSSELTTETNLVSLDSSLDDRNHSDGLTVQGDVFGTPSYMSPEQARGDHRNLAATSDVFSLGAILFEVLTGRRLYQEEQQEVDPQSVLTASAKYKISKSIDCLNQSASDQQLIDICHQCLQKSPNGRPANALLVADLISKYSDGIAERLKSTELEIVASEARAEEEKRRRRLTTILACTVVGAILLGVGAYAWYQFDLAKMKKKNDLQRAHTLVDAVATAPASALPFAIENLNELRQQALPILQIKFNEVDDVSQKLQLAIALSKLGDPQSEFLIQQIPDASFSVMSSILKSVSADAARAGPIINSQFAAEREPDIRARYAAVALQLGDFGPALTMTRDGGDVNDRTAFIGVFGKWKVEFDGLLNLYETASDPLSQYSTICAIAEVVSQDSGSKSAYLDTLGSSLQEILRSTRHANVRAAAELTFRRLGMSLEESGAESAPEDANWYVNSLGMNMVEIVLPQYPDQKLPHYGGYSFFVSDRETSHNLFNKFLNEDMEYLNRKADDPRLKYNFHEFLKLHQRPFKGTVSSETPQSGLEVYHAIRFCNWLSQREGFEPYYVDWSPKNIRDTYPSRNVRIEQWQENPFSNGYRLPGYYEFDFIAGGEVFQQSSPTFLNADETYHKMYEWYLVNSAAQMQPSARKLPNRFGLFDVVANLEEIGEYSSDWSRKLFSRGKRIFGCTFSSAELVLVNATAPPLIGAHAQLGDGFGFRVVRRDKKSLSENPPPGIEFKKVNKDDLGKSIDDPDSRFERLNCIDRKYTSPPRLGNMAIEYGRLGLEFQKAARHEDAITSFSACRTIAKSLVDSGHEASVFLTVLGGNFVNAANSLVALDRYDEAEQFTQQAISILSDAAKRFPEYKRSRQFLDIAKQVESNIQSARDSDSTDDQ